MSELFKQVVTSNGLRTKIPLTPEDIDVIGKIAPEPVSVDQVNAEAQRRIYNVMPQHEQANTTARAAVLAAKGSDNWTDADLAAWDAGLAEYMSIARLRAYSDSLNMMDPIPQDYAADKWWS